MRLSLASTSIVDFRSTQPTGFIKLTLLYSISGIHTVDLAHLALIWQ